MFMDISDINPIWLALAATSFTWACTAVGAGLVFFTKVISRLFLDVMLGFAAGVMLAASYWSLLAPAIAMSESLGNMAWLPAAVGFVSGAIFLRLVDVFLPHIHYLSGVKDGPSSHWKRTTLLVAAVTLHNIPEGLAVGVAFGAVAAGLPEAGLAGAMSLALGIGLQNLPEGAAVSMPLRGEGVSRRKAFLVGQASGLVEPVAGVIGAAAVVVMQPILPYALAFAAGAMVFVVVEEVVPESQSAGHGDWATMGLIAGFTLMMILDVAFG